MEAALDVRAHPVERVPVLHVGRIPDGSGGFRAQMAVLVKPNGLFGEAYMAAIRPFRHLIVYPAMMQRIEREARAVAAEGPRESLA